MRVARIAAVVSCSIVLLAGCSSDDAASDGGPDEQDTTSTTVVELPEGPVADVSTEIEGAEPPFVGEASPPDLEAADYVETEWVATGTATSYQEVGTRPDDGAWEFEPDAEADYRTRVLVRRPSDPANFSGTAVVEWLNVSGGLDANPEFTMLEEEVTRQGHVWVGVSAQLIGVEGGPVLVETPAGGDVTGKGLRVIDPERYESLEHPGDGYSFDIYTQVARAIREGGAFVGDETPDTVIAAGESQSAIALTTYYNGVQPLTEMFDGFLVHSRAGSALPLVGPDEYSDLAGALASGSPTPFRADLDAPVVNVQAESDVTSVLESYAARQDDSDTFRLWEVAGTAHADTRLIGSIAEDLDCGVPINDGPMHLVVKAGLRSLETWIQTGEAPPMAERLTTTEGDAPTIERDEDAIALGGVRTPPLDVPVDVLSGAPGSNPAIICILLGSTTPLSDDRLAELYPTQDDYVQEFDAAADDAIEAGFVLAEDRALLDDFADPSRIG